MLMQRTGYVDNLRIRLSADLDSCWTRTARITRSSTIRCIFSTPAFGRCRSADHWILRLMRPPADERFSSCLVVLCYVVRWFLSRSLSRGGISNRPRSLLLFSVVRLFPLLSLCVSVLRQVRIFSEGVGEAGGGNLPPRTHATRRRKITELISSVRSVCLPQRGEAGRGGVWLVRPDTNITVS